MGNATYKKTLNCRRPLPDDGEPDAEEADAPRAVGKLRGELFVFQKAIAISLTAFMVVAAIFSQQAYPKLKVEDYLSGKFSIPIGDQHTPSKEADLELNAILNWIELQEHADGAEANIFEDRYSLEMRQHFDFEEALQVGVLLDFCERRKNTDAALAAILVLPGRCASNKSAYKLVRDALETIQKRFPNTWQIYIVPLVIASVRDKEKTVAEDEANSRRDKFLASAPPKDFAFPEDSDVFKKVMKATCLNTPIRAVYLESIAIGYWNNACSGSTKEKERRLKQLDQAEKTYQHVIDEYPDSEQGKKAKKAISEEIPRIRKHIEAGLM